MRMRGNLFTEPLCGSGLHNLVVALLRACIAGCLQVRYLATLWPSTLHCSLLEVLRPE
jgi:hypothetical protein